MNTGTTGLLTQNLRFPGQYSDAETGDHQNGFRDYDPTVGRYLETDPIGLLGGLNTYAYTGNDPLNFRDPSGHLLVGAVAGGIAGGISGAYAGYQGGGGWEGALGGGLGGALAGGALGLIDPSEGALSLGLNGAVGGALGDAFGQAFNGSGQIDLGEVGGSALGGGIGGIIGGNLATAFGALESGLAGGEFGSNFGSGLLTGFGTGGFGNFGSDLCGAIFGEGGCNVPIPSWGGILQFLTPPSKPSPASRR